MVSGSKKYRFTNDFLDRILDFSTLCDMVHCQETLSNWIFGFFRYVKVYLLPDKSKSGKRKTKVKKHTLNPVFDEMLKVSWVYPSQNWKKFTVIYSIFNRKVLEKYSRNLSQFQFQMPLEEVERRTLWVTVWHSDMFGRNDFLDEVMLPINTIPLDDPQPRWYSLQDRVSLL